MKKKVIDNVRELLLEYPETRGDDMLLLIYYWTKIEKHVVIRDLKYATSAETIRRVRQKLQADNENLKPDDETQRRRIYREGEVRAWAKQSKLI